MIGNAPQEKLRCATRGGYYEYYSGKKYLDKNQRAFAVRLAQREYCLKLEKKIELYPDFTVLNKRTGRKWIIEHLGMMDKPAYYENALRKLELYEKNDILLGKGLIIFHETANVPLNTKIVQKYIDEYLC